MSLPVRFFSLFWLRFIGRAPVSARVAAGTGPTTPSVRVGPANQFGLSPLRFFLCSSEVCLLGRWLVVRSFIAWLVARRQSIRPVVCSLRSSFFSPVLCRAGRRVRSVSLWLLRVCVRVVVRLTSNASVPACYSEPVKRRLPG